MVADKPRLKETPGFALLKKLNRPENILVIQNAPFDLGVLRNDGFEWQGRVVDTLVCAKHLLATRRHALQFLRYELGLYRHEKALADALEREIRPHDAISDVLVTKLLLNHLLEHVGGDIENLITLSTTPALLQTIGFGKYRGKRYEETVAADRDYFEWVLREFKQLTPEARATIEYWFANPA
jgi:DNA polymerase III epsilon subunit-like protein